MSSVQSRECDWCGISVVALNGEPYLSEINYGVAGAQTSALVCGECLEQFLRMITQRGWGSPRKSLLESKPAQGSESTRKLLEVWQVDAHYQIRSLVGLQESGTIEVLRRLVTPEP